MPRTKTRPMQLPTNSDIKDYELEPRSRMLKQIYYLTDIYITTCQISIDAPSGTVPLTVLLRRLYRRYTPDKIAELTLKLSKLGCLTNMGGALPTYIPTLEFSLAINAILAEYDKLRNEVEKTEFAPPPEKEQEFIDEWEDSNNAIRRQIETNKSKGMDIQPLLDMLKQRGASLEPQQQKP